MIELRALSDPTRKLTTKVAAKSPTIPPDAPTPTTLGELIISDKIDPDKALMTNSAANRA
jgi:hypothetical protein